jgi:hypothetical protein
VKNLVFQPLDALWLIEAFLLPEELMKVSIIATHFLDRYKLNFYASIPSTP